MDVRLPVSLLLTLLVLLSGCCVRCTPAGSQEVARTLGPRPHPLDTGQSRTFGVRRLKIAIPIIMFKLGAMTTLLGFLTLIALKTLAIGLMLLISHLSAFLAKLKHGHHGWPEPDHGHHGPPQDIHVHIHKDGHETHHVTGPGGHHAWDKVGPGGLGAWDKVGTGDQMISLNRLRYLNSLYQQEI